MKSLFRLFAIIVLCLLLLSPPSCFCTRQPEPLTPSRELLVVVEVEEKTRLGSTPPSCHNKCNACHPCMAVQVPPLPGHEPVGPGLTRTEPAGFFDPSPRGNKYSNYKPLGWKCRCGDHLFNP